MPKAKRAARALVTAEAMAALVRLAGDGVYLATTPSPDRSDEACAVFAPENGFTDPVGHVSRPAIAYSLRKGWLDWDKVGRCLRISAAGQRALAASKTKAKKKSGAPSVARAPRDARRTEQALRPGGEGPLAMLRRRKHKDGRPLVTEAQFSAAEMLTADFWHGQLSPRVTANWSVLVPAHRMRRPTPGTGVEMRDSVAAARQRFHRALNAVGPELAGVLVDVCCHDLGLEAAGRAWGWPQRAAKVVLDLALTRLARHYGLIAPERPAGSRMRHWGDADYRPTIDTWR